MTPSPSRSQRRLSARTITVSALSPAAVDEAFCLFEASYAGADRKRFDRDLREKQRIILLRDRDTGALKGFSTVHIQRRQTPRPCTVIFSGDTVIDREYWGQKQLQSAFARILVVEKLRAPRQPLYWLLLSKGYRTYMLLANAFPRAIPRHDRPADETLQAMLNAIATERFGAQYDAVSGIVRFERRDRVRDGLAPITQGHLDNPHLRFFVARNPGHAEGDELACLADVRLVDIARIAMRLARHRLGGTRARAERSSVVMPQAEGA